MNDVRAVEGLQDHAVHGLSDVHALPRCEGGNETMLVVRAYVQAFARLSRGDHTNLMTLLAKLSN